LHGYRRRLWWPERDAYPAQVKRGRVGRAARAIEHSATRRLGRRDGDQGGDREDGLNRSAKGGQGTAGPHLRIELWTDGIWRQGNIRRPTADAGADHRDS